MWKDLNKTYNLNTLLINYKGKCVIIKPRQDVIPEETVYKIKELVPQSKIVMIERGGHYPQLENPEAFYPALKMAFSDNQ